MYSLLGVEKAVQIDESTSPRVHESYQCRLTSPLMSTYRQWQYNFVTICFNVDTFSRNACVYELQLCERRTLLLAHARAICFLNAQDLVKTGHKMQSRNKCNKMRNNSTRRRLVTTRDDGIKPEIFGVRVD